MEKTATPDCQRDETEPVGQYKIPRLRPAEARRGIPSGLVVGAMIGTLGLAPWATAASESNAGGPADTTEAQRRELYEPSFEESGAAPRDGLPDWMMDNLRWTIDLSSRAGLFTDTGRIGTTNIVGLDLHKVFSDVQGDWGTLTVQLYLTRIDDIPSPPPFFESDEDWELVTRITNFNYTGLAGGRFNIKAGHFEIPFGLEVPVNTNGTLRQMITARNLGVVADWGVGVNGVLPEAGATYEVTISRGSGIEYFNRWDPFIVAGRVGTSGRDDLEFGVSALHGEIAGRSGTIRRTRVGVDGQWYPGPIGLLAEVSVGRNDDDDVANALIELNSQNAHETVTGYMQARVFTQRFDSGWDDAASLVWGVRFTPDRHWALSAQFEQNLTVFRGSRDGVLSVQLRYRF